MATIGGVKCIAVQLTKFLGGEWPTLWGNRDYREDENAGAQKDAALTTFGNRIMRADRQAMSELASAVSMVRWASVM